jgi:hypothetical protein
MPNLHELASFYRALEAEVIANDGEFTDDQLRKLEEYQDDIDTKIDACIVIKRTAACEAAKNRQWAGDFEALARAYQSASDRLDRWIVSAMRVSGLDVAGKRVPHRLVRNAEPSYKWTGDEPIPDHLRRVKIELDTKACKALEKSGQPLPEGVISERGYHLRAAGIRRKGAKDDDRERDE